MSNNGGTTVETNPYESPTIVPQDPKDVTLSKRAPLRSVLRVVAIICWLLGAFVVLIGILAIQAPPAAYMFRTQPYEFVVILSSMFVLPPCGFFLWGLAGWLRSVRYLVFGSAAFAPIILLIVIRAFL